MIGIDKVRNFVNILDNNFQQMLIPGTHLSIDEAMITYNGRLLWKQYMPKKPTKWGIQLWFLCDSISGYCLTFRVYTGCATNTDLIREFGLASVVMELMQHYLMRHHHLYADNFFSSLPLVEDLYAADTYYTAVHCGKTGLEYRGSYREVTVNKSDDENVLWPTCNK